MNSQSIKDGMMPVSKIITATTGTLKMCWIVVLLGVVCVGQQADSKQKGTLLGQENSVNHQGTYLPALKPYSEVISQDAKSIYGVFTVHQVKGNYYFEV